MNATMKPRHTALTAAALALALASVSASALSAAAAPAARAAKQQVSAVLTADSEHAGYEAWRAMDGDPSTLWHTNFSTAQTPLPHTLAADLRASREIKGFVLTPRQDGGANGVVVRYEAYVTDNPASLGTPAAAGTLPAQRGTKSPATVVFDTPKTGRHFILKVLSAQTDNPSFASVAELKLLSDAAVFRASAAGAPSADADFLKSAGPERAGEFSRLSYDIRNKGKFAKLADQTFLQDALILPDDRDPADVVLRRTEALLKDLDTRADSKFSAFTKQLNELKKESAQTPVADAEKRRALFVKICTLRREIAFSNPLLNFGDLLFVKKHRATFNHMCDQYYGVNLPAGGGVFILKNPFTKNTANTTANNATDAQQPELINLLKNSVVQSGRLAGKKLEGGSFLSPNISYDGKKLAFAYVECEGDKHQRFHTDPTRGHWHQGRSFHIFTCNIDGSDLRQITDGTWNDFDPCWLPNGRLAFITERRGGYLRCGRECPTYTLFDMNPDGSQIRCLSYHETNEWNPSVTHDGRILYTRWDYPDRHGCTAHQPWITTLDGRDPRHVYGNFTPRNKRPDMDLNVRAIPGSPKFISTAAPHHGQAYGSLTIIDPRVDDDDAMAPVKRLTPEIAFPESQGGTQVYGSAWPLSEKYHIAVADFSLAPGQGRQGGRYLRGDYGIYLVDAFGNKELIYRDPEIGCNSPMAIVARPLPPVPAQQISDKIENQPFLAPELEKQAGREKGKVLLVNAYESLRPLPKGVKIKALRVVQLIPMSVPSGRPPHEIGFREPTSGDSVVMARHVLGTVPVEEDGSAHFEVPPRREFMLQILDEEGLAVQSMRSSIYLHDGETLSCTGCHEQTASAPRPPSRAPKAFQRKPSQLTPDHPDARPFSYARLVQPIWDKHCVTCHDDARAKGNKKAINLGKTPIRSKWFASFNNLVPKFGFYSYGNPLRTYPGKFGARASKLYPLLKSGHGKVKLTPDELHRVALWLDCVSPFYGVYEKEGGEAQLRGEVVWPTLE